MTTPTAPAPPEVLDSTHWESCWQSRGHHACAIARVDELTAQLSAAQDVSPDAALDALVATLTDYGATTPDRIAPACYQAADAIIGLRAAATRVPDERSLLDLENHLISECLCESGHQCEACDWRQDLIALRRRVAFLERGDSMSAAKEP